MSSKQFILLLTVFIISNSLSAQAKVDTSMDASGIQEIYIILDNTYTIEITNTSEKNILLHSISEGEYQNKVLVKATRDKNRITIKDDIQPFSENHNDKLGAHKIISLRMRIQIPEYMNVHLRSRIASLTINAKFKTLFAELSSGDCTLNSFIGNATVHTLSGDIKLFTKDAIIKASSKSGLIIEEKIWGSHHIALRSIHGNITVKKLEEH